MNDNVGINEDKNGRIGVLGPAVSRRTAPEIAGLAQDPHPQRNSYLS
jgi:hypothetical protein